MKILQYIGVITLMALTSCHTEPKIDKEALIEDVIDTKGDSIVTLAIQSHGGERYDEANFQFVFRDKQYQFINFGDQFEYSREQIVEGDTILDILSDQSFQRIVNGKPVELPESASQKYSESINSVIYFATLPHKLGDKAVIKYYKGQETIANHLYDAVEISFHAEGGGKDHEDVFYYWFNAETHQIDYLAYQYATNGGGVRFRAVYNRQIVGGITFQDYVNYEVPVGTALATIPRLYEQGQLEELSRIDTENIRHLKQ